MLALLLLVICILPVDAQWVAFNDHAAGTGTHANTTRYDVFGNGRETNGLLRSIATGAILPASVKITRTGTGVSGAQAADNPAAGTLLQAVFGG